MKNSVFTFLRTEGLSSVMELNQVEIARSYCYAVMISQDAILSMSYDKASEAGKALKKVTLLLEEIAISLFDTYIDESGNIQIADNPLQEGLEETVYSLRHVMRTIDALECIAPRHKK